MLRRMKFGWTHKLAWLEPLAFMAGGIVTAALAVLVLRAFDVDPEAQRAVAFLCVAGALLVLMTSPEHRPEGGFAATATLLGLAASGVAALAVVGPIEKVPALGCINSDGHLKATISRDMTVVYEAATTSSDPTGLLLLRGCQVNFVGWCIGAVHPDAVEPAVRDSRWLILEERRGLVPNGHTVGTIPRDEEPSKCRKGKPPPDRIQFTKALIDQRQGWIRLWGKSPRAAVIGYAVQLPDGNWRRLGWDAGAENDQPHTVLMPSGIRPGATVAASACIGFERPHGPVARLRLKETSLRGKQPIFVDQPEGDDPAEVACMTGDVPSG